MSNTIKLSSYFLLPFFYLVLNIKIISLGVSFPVTVATFIPIIFFLYIEKININKFIISLFIGGVFTVYNYIFGLSFDSSKYFTSTLLFIYMVVIISLTWSSRFRNISDSNTYKIYKFLALVIYIVVAISALQMFQIITTGTSSIMASLSDYLVYTNTYVLNFIHYGGRRTTSLYFEPAFYALTLISLWLSIKQFGITTKKIDIVVCIGVALSGSFSGLMTFIIFYFIEWIIKYGNKEAIRSKIHYAIITFVLLIVGLYFAFPYISQRLMEVGSESSSSYYRIIGPLKLVYHALFDVNGIVRFGSLYNYVAKFGIFNGADVGKTVDNGLYLLIIYFSWLAVILYVWYLNKLRKVVKNSFGVQSNFLIQLYLFTPMSLFFTGSIFSPEYIFLLVCPFVLRKALNQSKLETNK